MNARQDRFIHINEGEGVTDRRITCSEVLYIGDGTRDLPRANMHNHARNHQSCVTIYNLQGIHRERAYRSSYRVAMHGTHQHLRHLCIPLFPSQFHVPRWIPISWFQIRRHLTPERKHYDLLIYELKAHANNFWLVDETHNDESITHSHKLALVDTLSRRVTKLLDLGRILM